MLSKIRKFAYPLIAATLIGAIAACSQTAQPAPVAPQQPAPAAPALAPQPAAPAMAAPAPAAPPAPQPAAPAAPSTMAAPVPQQAAAPAAPHAAAPTPAILHAQPAQAMTAPAPAPQAAPPAASSAQLGPGASPPPPSQYGGTRPPITTFKDNERTGTMPGDRVSTFSLDTDRTSYQLALNWARAGYEIDPDSVRAEEWINAFNYGYAQPARDDSFAIHTDVIDHPLNAGMLMARIAFQAPDADYDATPLNVTLVLDASGSMSDGNRVDIARAAAESIRASLRPTDTIAVVHFTDGVVHDLTVRHARPDDRAVRQSIDKLRPRGSTNVQAGLDLGVELAQQARYARPDAYNYIILMSDGVANVDATNPFAILESAADRDDANPLRLITIGVGIGNYNDYLLEQLAQHGNGWYRYLNDVGHARATFARENWLALSIPFADQTRAQVTWNPDIVDTWRILGYENRITSEQNFAQARKEFAEIPAGAATTVFYELDLVDEGRNLQSNATLGNVEVRWVTPDTGDSNRQHAPITANYPNNANAAEYAYLKLGALVALASDRYGSPPHADGGLPGYSIRADLDTIKWDIDNLQPQLGNLTAYNDFTFLLDHMTAHLPARASGAGSGYSR